MEKQVFKNVGLFMKDKSPGDDLFDRLNVSLSSESSLINLHEICVLTQQCGIMYIHV